MNKQKPVVVLDDDAAVRSSLCAMLTSMGVSCEGFDSQNDFIDRIKSGPEVGALLIDLRLANETSGIQVLHDVRAVGNHRPAILMSGWEVGELDEALGPVAQIGKPFDYEELVNLLASLEKEYE